MKLIWTDRHPLTELGVDKIKAVAGVYKLIHHDKNSGNFYVHYVGQAEDLNNRLDQHLSGKESNKKCQKHLDGYDCYFRAAAVSRQADRDGAEVALYNKYNPSCNERVPDVDPVDINFD